MQTPTRHKGVHEYMKKLGKFLKAHCKDEYEFEAYEFAKDLTLEQFLLACERGDWILWLFARTNPDSLQQLTLAKGHCANSIRDLMKDDRSIKAVDTAIVFGEGKATREELDNAANEARKAVNEARKNAPTTSTDEAARAAAVDSAWASASASEDCVCAIASAWASVWGYDWVSTEKKNQKLTADICRKYLPLSIWDQSKI